MNKVRERFCKIDAAQDVVEYTLLLAFVVIFSAALLLTTSDSAQGIWNVTNAHLNHGLQTASN